MPDANSQDRTHTAPAAGTRTMGVGLVPADTATYSPDSPAALPTPLPDRTTPFGPPGFDLLGKISEGGMGVVLKARDLAVGRVVALKVLKLNAFDERAARVRFTREVRAMARIEHPNLVPVYQSGEYNGVPYFTMKYMPGGTLGVVRAGGPLSPQRAAELLRAIADGVAAMHACHILHRDLKPSNVLLDEHGTPHVADFGLVKWTDEDDHTQTGARNGTPQYMSPEQVAGRSRKLTAACDVWALGVIGYELVCGKRPFEQEDREDLYRAITHDRPADPCEVVPDVPAPLAAVLLACLAKDPLARYPSARELVADLDRFLAGESVNATSPETVSLPPPPRRRTFLKVTAGVLGLGAAGGLGAYLFTRKTPPPPPLTFAEQVLADLLRGEKVDLLNAEGLPRWHAVYPEAGLVLTADEAGGVRVTRNKNQGRPFPVTYLDLFPEPLPPGYRLEMEWELTSKLEPNTCVSVCVGRRSWATANGDWQTGVAVTCTPARPGKPPRPELFKLEVLADPPPVLRRGDTVTSPQEAFTRPPPPTAGLVTLAVEVTANGFAIAAPPGLGGVITGKAPAPLKVADARQMLAKLVGVNPIIGRPPDTASDLPDVNATPDPFAGGLGVYLRAADVVVRSARLIPFPPAP